MADTEQQIAELQARVENVFAIDARLKALDADVRKLKSSSLRDWLQTLGPYISGLIILVVGFMIKDSVTLAMQREQLDLEYVKQIRELIKNFDEDNTLPAANANALALALYGKHAITPLLERLGEGDVAHVAAEKGLLLIGTTDPAGACPKFAAIATDKSRLFTWQLQKAIIRIMGQSSCLKAIPVLENYKSQLSGLGTSETKLNAFAQRFSEAKGFDAESVATLIEEIDTALEILRSQVQS